MNSDRPVLIATDGSDLAGRAVAHGIGLARALAAPVVIVNVLAPLHSLGDEQDMFVGQPEAIRKAAIDFVYSQSRQILDHAAAMARDASVACRTRSMTDENPYRAILAVAAEENCRMIVVATHGRGGLAAFILGSQTSKLLAHADRPVLVCR